MRQGGDQISRVSVPTLDELLGRRFPVLDEGFVRVVDYMGSDDSIVQAARVSYGAGTKQVRQDEALIRYLMRHRHTTPFEMCELKLHVRAPMDCWRQWIRHRTANVNEYSTRYSMAIDTASRTAATDWRLQAALNRQGSEGFLDSEMGAELTRRERDLHELARKVYSERLERGVAREQARKDLPLSTYTEAYWKIDLHNLLNFLELRMHQRAQYEIRQYARTIGNDIVRIWCPTTWAAFIESRINAVVLTERETALTRAIVSEGVEAARKLAESYSWVDSSGSPNKNRERLEAEDKLRSLGIPIPWST